MTSSSSEGLKTSGFSSKTSSVDLRQLNEINKNKTLLRAEFRMRIRINFQFLVLYINITEL
jgi:hypothetical protein